MKVFMKKEVARVGKSGIIITVPDGYARNYLLPQGFALEVTPSNEASLKKKLEETVIQKQNFIAKTSLLADKIRDFQLVLKRKMHDNGKLYGAISAHDIVMLLAENDVKITKNQVIFDKLIKAKGLYTVTIQLTSQLKTNFNLTIVSE